MRIDKYLEIFNYLGRVNYRVYNSEDITTYVFESGVFRILVTKNNKILFGFDPINEYKDIDEVNKMIYQANQIFTINDIGIFWGTVEWSEEDNCFCGKLTQNNREPIKDLVLYEGETLEELRMVFERAVDEYSKEINTRV